MSTEETIRRSVENVLIDDYDNDQLRLILKETNTTTNETYSEEVLDLMEHEDIKDDPIYHKLKHINESVRRVIAQKVILDIF